ncbi:N-acetylmuramoyl-L-alanine amidase [Xanthobacter sp. KR7-65]
MAREARLAGDAQRTRLILDLDRATEFRAFTLANPPRVILDLSDVTFALKPDAAQLKRGLVAAYRFGVFAPGKARMVLEVTGPVAIDKAFVLEALDDQPARLVVDLVKTDPEAFARSIASAAEQRTGLPATPVTPAPAGDGRPVVVIDPGHGGIDSGTSGYSAFVEKTLVLETALALRDRLEKSGNYRVVLTRSTDTFVPLGERVRIARANRADLFLSLHADALARGDGQARGASVYTLSETASDADAAHLAEKENKADLIAGVDLTDETDEVAGILVDLAQRETRNFSAWFARTLVGSMKSATRMHRSPLKSAGFRVLRAHDVPSVLVELGYMSSPDDLKQLASEAGRDRMAEAIAAGVTDFFARKSAGGHLVEEKGGAGR